jgi:ribonuclease PH
VEVQATAEHTPFEDGQLNELLALARTGIAQLRTAQAEALVAHRLRHG